MVRLICRVCKDQKPCVYEVDGTPRGHCCPLNGASDARWERLPRTTSEILTELFQNIEGIEEHRVDEFTSEATGFLQKAIDELEVVE